jgi:hypothetical protein
MIQISYLATFHTYHDGASTSLVSLINGAGKGPRKGVNGRYQPELTALTGHAKLATSALSAASVFLLAAKIKK